MDMGRGEMHIGRAHGYGKRRDAYWGSSPTKGIFIFYAKVVKLSLFTYSLARSWPWAFARNFT